MPDGILQPGEMTRPLLEISDLSVTFPARGAAAGGNTGLKAVCAVSLVLARKERLGIVGESGSGKSTIARVLAGLQKPTAGTINYRNQPITWPVAASVQRHLQMVFQDPASSLNPRMRIWTQVSEPARGHLGVHSRAQRRELAAKALAAVGLDAAALDRYPHAFSGGQRQRIAIARALIVDPDILIADEPMSSLDVGAQSEIARLLDALCLTKGLSLILISHDLSQIAQLTRRVMVLYLGRIMEEGPTETVLRQPAHPYTRALLDAAPRLAETGARQRVILCGDPPSPVTPPTGCVFRTRCPLAMPRCAREIPPPVSLNSGHRSACFLSSEK